MADTVKTSLTYLVDTGVKPVTFVSRDDETPRGKTAEYTEYEAEIRNARPCETDFTLDKEGFELRRRPTAVKDFFDEDAVKNVYWPELEQFVLEVTGAKEVVVFDTTIRVEDEDKRALHKVGRPVQRVHNDYTAWSAPKRVRELVPVDKAEELLKGRFAIINVWRPIRGPVESMPLAVCDARSIAPEDLVSTERRAADRVGEVQHLTYNPDHRWWYFPKQEVDETTLIKCYDSAVDGRARYTAHTGFVDPTTPAGIADRQSIEARNFVFY